MTDVEFPDSRLSARMLLSRLFNLLHHPRQSRVLDLRRLSGWLDQLCLPSRQTKACECAFQRRLPYAWVSLENSPDHSWQKPSVAQPCAEKFGSLVPGHLLQSSQELRYFQLGVRSHYLHAAHQHSNQLVGFGRYFKRKDGVCLLPRQHVEQSKPLLKP